MRMILIHITIYYSLMYREALLAFRHLPATKKLPKDLDVDVLRCDSDALRAMRCSDVFY